MILFVSVLAVMIPLLHYNGIVTTQLVANVLNVGIAALLYRISQWKELWV